MKNLILMGLTAGSLVMGVTAHAQTAWTDRVSLGGDLRFRYSHDQADTGGANTTDNYNQIRARLSASAKVNDAMTANFRLATHNGAYNNNSSNDTLGQDNTGAANTANKSAFDLELAYGDWRVMPGLVGSIGKAPNPFWQAGKNEMLWDADLAFEGLTGKWAADMGNMKPFVNASYNWIQHNAPATTNIMQLGVQAGASMGFGDMMKGTAAIAYHNFNNADQAGAAGFKISLVNVGAELGLNMVHNLPLAVFGDYVTNTASGTNTHETTGYTTGVKAGAFNGVGTWEAWYNYREVGAQAAVPTLGDSDFSPAASNAVDVRGHQIGGAYMAWDNTTVGANYINSTSVGTHHNERYIADLVWKF